MSDTQKILSSKEILKTYSFVVKEQILELPSGKKITRHTAESLSSVLIFPITPTYEVYLIDQYRFTLGENVLGAIAGTMDKKETILATAKRELEEEAGILARQWEMLAKIELSRAGTRTKAYLFLAKELEMTKAKLEEDEDITLVKMSLQEAVEKVMNGEIYHSPSMTGILMLSELKRRKQL